MNIIKSKKKPAVVIKNYQKPSAWRSALLLTLTVCSLIGAVVLRFMGGFEDEDQLEKLAIQQIKNHKNEQLIYTSVNNIESVGDFPDQVKSIVFEDVVLEQRNQDTAFQDIEYISERKKAWTIQIMDVSKIEIIKDYLATQEKREQFAYFRYIDANNNKRYILTFDDFNNEERALKALESNEFSLPSSILPFPRPFKEYVGLIEQYHLENKVKEYRKNRYREIKLNKTRAPIISNKHVVKNPSQTLSKPNKTRKTTRTNVKNNAFSKKTERSGRYVVSKGSTKQKDDINSIQSGNDVHTKNYEASTKDNGEQPIIVDSKDKSSTEKQQSINESQPTQSQDVIENLINQMN